MKTYELIIERRQPTCGGKSPKDVSVQTVQTEDPVAYVKAAEQTEDVHVSTSPAGELLVDVMLGAKQVRYCFSEE